MSRRRTERFAEAEFAAYVKEETAYARALYREGFLRQIWHRADVAGACMIVEAESEEEARRKLGALPMVQAGMLEVIVIPLQPYAGFGAAEVTGKVDRVPVRERARDSLRIERS